MRSAVGQENELGPAIAVEVVNGAARTDRLMHQVLVNVARIVREVQTGPRGDVLEPRGAIRRLDGLGLRLTRRVERRATERRNTTAMAIVWPE